MPFEPGRLAQAPDREPREQRSWNAYGDAVLVAVWVAIVAVFVGSLLLAVAFQELSEDELLTVLGLGVIPALAVGVIVGVKYAKLAGWRDWLLVGLGSIAGFVAMNIVVETLGDGALYGFMGAGVAVLFFNRNRRK